MKPTNKVGSAIAVSAVLLIISKFTEVDKDIEQAVNVIVPLIVAYWVKNAADTPKGDGVPA